MRAVMKTRRTYSYDKSALPALAAHRGKLVDGGEMDGKVFVGFAGRRLRGERDDGLYHGVLRYAEPAAGEQYETVTHLQLIQADGDTIAAELVDEPESEE